MNPGILGWMGSSPQALPPESIVEREVDRILRGVIQYRVLFAPIALVIGSSVVWVDDASWRRIVLGVVLVFGVAGSVFSRWRLTHPEREIPEEVAISFAATVPMQLVMLTVTGGIDSPLVVVLPPFLVLSGVLIGRSRWLAAMVGLEVAWVLLLTVLQGVDAVPALSLEAFGSISGVHRVVVGTVLCVAALLSPSMGIAIRAGLESMVARAMGLRDQQLHELQEQAHDLEVAGGELAHELKNPLASIQGLASLLAKEIPSEKGTQRLAVLRDEAHRMSEVLEEFLTYSRPLTPLTLTELDGLALLEGIRDLHEGVAVERGVRVVATGAPASLQGDARKIQRALINLVQNALAVAPRGSPLELAVEPGVSGVVFEVRDRGPGIPAELADRVFQAGVTATEGGSGLGLTIARTLIRQHGGELTLVPRPGGGTIARVELP